MANQRLINCDFFLKGAFDDVSSNEAKLLYFYFFINADDMGFVGNASKIIKDLKGGVAEQTGLVDCSFENALDDLVNKGFLYRFTDKHQNQIYLIRQWFIHNKPNFKYISTNYLSLRAQVEIVDGCYEKKENHIKKENKESKERNENKEEKKEKEKSANEIWKELEESSKQYEEDKNVYDPLGIVPLDDIKEEDLLYANKKGD